MKIVFYYSDKSRERILSEALKEGVVNRKDDFEMILTQDFDKPLPDTDVACMIGVKGRSKEIMDAHLKEGMNTLYFDKGYIRRKAKLHKGWEYWRVSVNSFQPLEYFQKIRQSSDRWDKFRYKIHQRTTGQTVLVALSSQKYCNWHNLGDATKYAKSVLKISNKNTGRKIIYRPKPTWKEAVEIKGFGFSRLPTSITDELKNAHVLITYGSNAAFDAVINGIPSIVLGDGIAKPISSTSLTYIEKPFFPAQESIYQWCCDLSYCQWTLEEFYSGEAREHLRRQIVK